MTYMQQYDRNISSGTLIKNCTNPESLLSELSKMSSENAAIPSVYLSRCV